MTGRLLIVGMVALTSLMAVTPNAQVTPGTFGANPIWHIGVVVRNLEASAKAYADLLGVPVPPMPSSTRPPRIPYPPTFKGDRNAYAKQVYIGYKDFAIELMEPVGGSSPWRDHLEKFGEGPFHIAWGVDDVAAATEYLRKFGGVVEIGGVPGAEFAYINFKPQLGFTIEVSKMQDVTAKNVPPDAFGANPTSRITVVQTDLEKSAALFEQITGVMSPPLRTVGADTNIYPGLGFAPAGEVKLADRFRMNVHMELQQAMSKTPQSPWRIAYDARGPSIYYLGWWVKDMDASLDYLVKKGGTVVTTNRTKAFAYIDMPSPISMKVTIFPESTNR